MHSRCTATHASSRFYFPFIDEKVIFIFFGYIFIKLFIYFIIIFQVSHPGDSVRALPPDVPTVRLGIRRRDDPCVPQPGVPRLINGPVDRTAQDPARARNRGRAGCPRG